MTCGRRPEQQQHGNARAGASWVCHAPSPRWSRRARIIPSDPTRRLETSGVANAATVRHVAPAVIEELAIDDARDAGTRLGAPAEQRRLCTHRARVALVVRVHIAPRCRLGSF